MVLLGPGHFSANRRDIVKVVFVDVRQSYLIERVHIEIFGRYVPGQMGAEKAAAEEKRLVVPFLQLLYGPIGDLRVAHLTVGHVHRTPVEVGGIRDAV